LPVRQPWHAGPALVLSSRSPQANTQDYAEKGKPLRGYRGPKRKANSQARERPELVEVEGAGAHGPPDKQAGVFGEDLSGEF
jgi:hypothetical protein